MIRIDCFTRDGCDACKIAIKNITDAINEANCDITLNIRNTNLDDILRKEITKFPTTVITKVDNDYKRKELARLEGSFPSDYIKDIINKLEDPTGDTLKENDIKRFIKGIENVKVGTKTTNTTLTCLTGFEVHGQAACVKPENFDLNVGSNYARIKAEDKIWEGLGFVLQWAKYGLKK